MCILTTLIATDLKHLLSLNPLQPAYADTPWLTAHGAPALAWQAFDAGIVHVGHQFLEAHVLHAGRRLPHR